MHEQQEGPQTLQQLGVLAGAAVISAPCLSHEHLSSADEAEFLQGWEVSQSCPGPGPSWEGTAREDENCSCCQGRRDVAESSAAGEVLLAPEWMLVHKPVLNVPVNSRSQPGFCGLWPRCQQAQAISAAAGSALACPSMQLALPLGRDGSHRSSVICSGLAEQLCPSSLGDPVGPSMRESLVHHPPWGVQTVCASRWLPHSPIFLCQATQGANGHHRLGPSHTLLWDQSRAGH